MALPEIGSNYLLLLGQAEVSDQLLNNQWARWQQSSAGAAGQALARLTGQTLAMGATDQKQAEQRGTADSLLRVIARSERMELVGYRWRSLEGAPTGWQPSGQAGNPADVLYRHVNRLLEQAQKLQSQKQYEQARQQLLVALGAGRNLAYSAPTLNTSQMGLLLHHRALRRLEALYDQQGDDRAGQEVAEVLNTRTGGSVLTLLAESHQNLEGLHQRGAEVFKHPRVPAAIKWSLFRTAQITQSCYGMLSSFSLERPDLRHSLLQQPGGSWLYAEISEQPLQGISPERQPLEDCWSSASL